MSEESAAGNCLVAMHAFDPCMLHMWAIMQSRKLVSAFHTSHASYLAMLQFSLVLPISIIMVKYHRAMSFHEQ